MLLLYICGICAFDLLICWPSSSLKGTVVIGNAVSDVGQSTMQTMSRLTSAGGKEAELLETAISSLK